MSERLLDLHAERGGWTQQWAYRAADGVTPVVITGWSAVFRLERDKGQVASDLALTEAAGITINGVAGTATVAITDAQMALLTASAYYYTMWLVPTGGLQPVLLSRGLFQPYWAVDRV